MMNSFLSVNSIHPVSYTHLDVYKRQVISTETNVSKYNDKRIKLTLFGTTNHNPVLRVDANSE